MMDPLPHVPHCLMAYMIPRGGGHASSATVLHLWDVLEDLASQKCKTSAWKGGAGRDLASRKCEASVWKGGEKRAPIFFGVSVRGGEKPKQSESAPHPQCKFSFRSTTSGVALKIVRPGCLEFTPTTAAEVFFSRHQKWSCNKTLIPFHGEGFRFWKP